MEKFDELLKVLKEQSISQKSIDWEEDIEESLYDKYFKDSYKEVYSGLSVDTHRWYELSTSVYEMYESGRYLGVHHITNVFSESTDVEDCYMELEFFEMKPVTTITYEEL